MTLVRNLYFTIVVPARLEHGQSLIRSKLTSGTDQLASENPLWVPQLFGLGH
jgi:hypothetical protein